MVECLPSKHKALISNQKKKPPKKKNSKHCEVRFAIHLEFRFSIEQSRSYDSQKS
jgi:hypothetical protein